MRIAVAAVKSPCDKHGGFGQNVVVHIHAHLVGGPQVADVAAACAGQHVGKVFLRRQERRVAKHHFLTDGKCQVKKSPSESHRVHHFEGVLHEVHADSIALPGRNAEKREQFLVFDDQLRQVGKFISRRAGHLAVAVYHAAAAHNAGAFRNDRLAGLVALHYLDAGGKGGVEDGVFIKYPAGVVHVEAHHVEVPAKASLQCCPVIIERFYAVGSAILIREERNGAVNGVVIVQVVHLVVIGQTALEPVRKEFLVGVANAEHIHTQTSERVNVSPAIFRIIWRYKNNIHR